MRLGAPALLCGLASLAAAALGASEAPLRIVTLSTVLTEVAQEVGGGAVTVRGLVGPGVDPHQFNPSPRDIREIIDADLVLSSGLNLEGYMRRVVANDVPAGRVLAVGDALPSPITITSPSGTVEEDPHWWHSIDNMLAAVEVVRAEFSRRKPGSAAQFSANAAAYSAHLTGLKAWAAREMARIPPERRILVTSHDAFGYLARDYAFTIRSIGGYSTEGEADGRRMAALVDYIRLHRVPAVFVESSANPRMVQNLVEETGVRLGGTLYADGLGPVGSGAETYESMYRSNVTAIVAALGNP
ncbi:MAG TPA: zinc ABC transporter substrate-binding protein [Opitutaceae bacterium]